MINAILDRLGPVGQKNLMDAFQDVTRGVGANEILKSQLSRSDMRSLLRTARKGARGAASRTSAFAAAHPRQVGAGLGAAAVAAIGLYAVAKIYEGKDGKTSEALPASEAED